MTNKNQLRIHSELSLKLLFSVIFLSTCHTPNFFKASIHFTPNLQVQTHPPKVSGTELLTLPGVPDSELFWEFFPEELWSMACRDQVVFPHLVPGKDLVRTFNSSKVPRLESPGSGWWEMKHADYQAFSWELLDGFSGEKTEDLGCTWVITSVGSRVEAERSVQRLFPVTETWDAYALNKVIGLTLVRS